MNMQPTLQSRSSSNGFSHRRVEREGVSNKAHSIKSHPVNPPNTVFGGEAEGLESFSRDRLVYLTTCKIGHLVEVHLKDGSAYSGIFHAADVEQDFGIILKMASLIKEGPSRGHKTRSEVIRKPHSKTFIIPADELVQVIAKDLSVSRDGVLNAVQSEKPLELLTDSCISQSYHVDMGRELKPWVPDEDVPQGPDLDNVFDDPWNRGWNQFEVNATLFGVKSTFDEELYTTKLARGPRTRELEEQALRIAREIEGENTRDLHVAEERGLQLNEKYDVDEETKYSSVRPVDAFDDSGYEEEEDILLDTCNDLTFGDLTHFDGKGYEESWGDSQSSGNNTNVDQSCTITPEQRADDFPSSGNNIRSEFQLGEQRNNSNPEVSRSNRTSEESVSGHGDFSNEDNSEGVKVASGATSVSPCPPPRAAAERLSSYGGRQVSQVSGKTKSESSSGRPGSSASKNSENRTAPSVTSRSALSPRSSTGSASSSTLNPNAKEFKLNPNAKSFKPAPSAAQPQSPISDGSFYYPAVPQMPGLPVGYGVAPQFPGHQPPLMYTPQTYFPPNGPPQYPSQQMMYGQARPMVYMQPPPYQPDMPYNNQGRDQ